jgi:hypothetical protein
MDHGGNQSRRQTKLESLMESGSVLKLVISQSKAMRGRGVVVALHTSLACYYNVGKQLEPYFLQPSQPSKQTKS